MKLLLTCLASVLALAGAPGSGVETPPAERAMPAPLDAAERARTMRELAAALSVMYLYPKIGKRYASALHANLARGTYDGLTNEKAFADEVIADLQALAPDLHLRLLPNRVLEHSPGPDRPSTRGLPEGIENMRMIGRVAYLRFNAFPHDPRTAPAARAFLLANAGNTKAVVIDARSLLGGGTQVMDAGLPLFYAEPTVLLSMETRAAGDRESPFSDSPRLVRRRGREGYITRDHILVPDATETRLRKTPLHYLTSSKTASAGEHLALALKRIGRATLIGETTREAGHFVALAPVGTRLTALVQVGRAYDPATGWDWEGKGVTPHIAVPAGKALDEAFRRIGRR